MSELQCSFSIFVLVWLISLFNVLGVFLSILALNLMLGAKTDVMKVIDRIVRFLTRHR